MTTKKTTKPDPTAAAAAPQLGTFAQLVADATEEYEPVEPYVIDDVYPAIIISEPVEAGRILPITRIYAEMTDEYGRPKKGKELQPKDFEPLLRALCGDAYDRVWNELLEDKHFWVTRAFINKLQKHFAPKVKPLPLDDAPEGAEE